MNVDDIPIGFTTDIFCPMEVTVVVDGCRDFTKYYDVIWDIFDVNEIGTNILIEKWD